MRELTINDLQFTFTDKINWNLKPMIKMRKVSYRGKNNKTVEDFYGELVTFEGHSGWLMLPKQIVVEQGSPETLKRDAVRTVRMDRLRAASNGVKIRKADFFMGKVQVELSNPMLLQGRTVVLVKFREMPAVKDDVDTIIKILETAQRFANDKDKSIDLYAEIVKEVYGLNRGDTNFNEARKYVKGLCFVQNIRGVANKVIQEGLDY